MPRRDFIPRGAGFFRGTWGRYLGLRRCVYRCSEQHPAPTSTCPCEYVARRPPHRRWVQETQPHTYGCAERILTAEFQSRGACRVEHTTRSRPRHELLRSRRPVPRWTRSESDAPTQPHDTTPFMYTTISLSTVHLPTRGSSPRHSAVLLIFAMFRCPSRSNRNSFMTLDLI